MRTWLLAFLLVVSVPAIAQGAADAVPNTSAAQHASRAQSKLDDILMSDVYSHRSTITEQPTKEESAELSWLQRLLEWLAQLGQWSQALGVLGKTLALALLVAMAWWVVKHRQTWLAWFGQLSLPKLSHSADIQAQPAPQEKPWHSLPPKDQLLTHLRALLEQGNWLVVLALLYQGTLRELGQSHQLPIDKHQTEDECVWLLQTAKSASAKEQAYFAELVALWRASAYGKRIPDGIMSKDYTVIYRLMNAWGAIYGERS